MGIKELLRKFSYHSIRKHEVVRLEIDVLAALHGTLHIPTIFTFLCRYVRAAFFHATDCQLVNYLAERCLLSSHMICHTPSQIAAACTYITAKTSYMNSHNSCKDANHSTWTNTLVHYTEYSLEQVLVTVAKIKLHCFNPSEIAVDMHESNNDTLLGSTGSTESMVSPLSTSPSAFTTTCVPAVNDTRMCTRSHNDSGDNHSKNDSFCYDRTTRTGQSPSDASSQMYRSQGIIIAKYDTDYYGHVSKMKLYF